MEIERKYLIHKLPEDLETYPCRKIQQAYLCTNPVVRIRRQDQDYYLTYKGGGLMVRAGKSRRHCPVQNPVSPAPYRHPYY